jgi:hypothetical protein
MAVEHICGSAQGLYDSLVLFCSFNAGHAVAGYEIQKRGSEPVSHCDRVVQTSQELRVCRSINKASHGFDAKRL